MTEIVDTEMAKRKVWVSWKVWKVSGEKGRREVQYVLKDAKGRSELAVVGKERSLRHMSYAVVNHSLRSIYGFSNLRSRREVVDFLDAIVSDYSSHGSSRLVDRFSYDEEDRTTNVATYKEISSGKVKHNSKGFSWLGSSWTCKKRRKHYQSFCRMGFTISVNNFVHVMAEENKRLVAYVEDMYEDSRVNRMVVVRWFHKVDEVGIVLPPDVNDREIFFSLCLQDFSVECIDGLAVVLNPQHFDKFLNEAKHVHWELPYMCRRQIDNDDVKAFDITQVQGYWKQEIIRRLLTGSMRIRLKLPRTSAGSKSVREQTDEPLKTNKHEGEKRLKSRVTFVEDEKRISNNGVITRLPRIDEGLNQSAINWLSTGSRVEVLSQDSGIRGCWFTGIVLKKYQDKVKVRYDDLQDADETGCLEEWILASRVAAPDQLGVHLCGRTVVRPCLLSKCTVELGFDAGEMVDAWWCDGWWEGIILRREAEDKVHVYLPGEKRNLVFSQVNLRHSQDWLGNKWHAIKGRPDLVHLLLGDGECEIDIKSNEDVFLIGQPSVLPEQPTKIHVECPPSRALNSTTKESSPKHDRPNDGEKENEVPNLVKDSSLTSLKWSLSKKRRRSGRDRQAGSSKRQRDGTSSSSSGEDGEPQSSPSRKQQFLFTDPVKLEHDNCSKFGGNHSHFGAPVPLSSLVMSR